MKKQKKFKAEGFSKNNKKEDEMVKRRSRESVNLASLVVGIIFIVLGEPVFADRL